MSEPIDLAQAGIEVTTAAHLASPSLLGEYVARLPSGQQALFLDGLARGFDAMGPGGYGQQMLWVQDGVNNALANLRYATAEENAQDARVHGGNAPAARTHCPRGHILEPPNLVLGALARGGRNCLACGRAAREVSRLRSLGKTVTPDERQRISDRKFAALTGLTICDCDKDTR